MNTLDPANSKLMGKMGGLDAKTSSIKATSNLNLGSIKTIAGKSAGAIKASSSLDVGIKSLAGKTSGTIKAFSNLDAGSIKFCWKIFRNFNTWGLCLK